MANTATSLDKLLPLTPRVFHILLALVDGPEHGYQIMKEVEERSGGKVRIGPGTLYEAIQRLVKNGVIEESAERPETDLDDQRRRYYRITAEGERACATEVRRMETLLRNARKARPKLGHA